MVKTIDVIKDMLTRDNLVTRGVLRDIASHRLDCDRSFIVYLFDS